MYEPWMFVAMEEYGIMDTRTGRCNRVARYLAENGPSYIGNREFVDACRACNVDPYSFDQSDIETIRRKLDDLF